MLPTVLLFLSVLTVQGSGCDDFMKTTVRNLQKSLNREKAIGFPEVFPENYVVSHYFNDSALCNDSCCVFSAAVLLSNSWLKLLQHLRRVHLKYKFISELSYTLDKIAEKKFLESPDFTTFPCIQSTPEDLISFTSSLFSRWLDLNCAFGQDPCIFPSEEYQDYLESEEEGNMKSGEEVVEQQPIRVGETGKRRLNHDLTSGYTELCFPGFSWWILSSLWITTCASLI